MMRAEKDTSPTIRLAATADPAPPAELQEAPAVRAKAASPALADPRTKAGSDAAAVAPLVYSRRQLAEALGIDTSTLDRWTASGQLGPRPLRISGPRGRVLFSRREIADWVAAGCPDAAEWAHVWKAMQAHNGKR